MKVWPVALVALIAVGAVLVGLQTRQDGKVGTTSPTSLVTQRGFGFSPLSFNGSAMTSFFARAEQGGSMVSWSGDWNQLSEPAGAPAVVATLAKTNNLTTVIEVQFFSQANGRLFRPLDNETQDSYVQSAAAFAQKFHPAYMGIGVEVNVLFEKSPTDFGAFVNFFPRVYDAVKTASPGTRVFTTFQLEKMKGLDGGLFGGANDPSRSEWNLVGQFNRSDLIVFSTYPGLVYSNPTDLPQDYYSEIVSHVSKPVAFSEVGWQSNSTLSGWQGSQQAQAQFVGDFFGMVRTIHPQFAIWSFLYDQKVPEPFATMGLIGSSGAPKPAWDEWLSQG